MEPKRLYYFDSFCVDSAQRVLLRDGQIVSLGPKAFELLFALVERSGKVISREELTKRVWPDTTVEPGNLPFNINVLRKTLRNNGSGREYIQNIRGRGYRLLADVTIAEGGNGSAGSPKVAVGSPTGVLEPGNLSILESRPAEDRIPPKESHTLNGQPLETPQAPESGFRGHLHQIARLVRWTSPEQAGHSGRIPTPTAAFRGLLPFEQSDADRFYGRDIDSAALFDLVTHSDFRFGVLYGESGSGKSSLIRAGLLPRLNEAGLLGLYCRAYKDPISAMKEQCFAHTGMCAGQDEAPLDYLGRVTCSLTD